jgi:hypothetical protein
MGHQSSKVGFGFFKKLVVRDALTGEELCQLDNVDTASRGLEVKERIRKSIKDFEPSSKRLLWGSKILCDHLTLGEVMACSLSDDDGRNPTELSVLTRPATVQQWLHNHKQLNENIILYKSWTSTQRQAWKPFLDQAVEELKNADDDVRSDVECMVALVLDDGLMLQHASAELHDIDFLVMTAVKQNGLVLQYASPRLQDTDLIVSAALKQNGLALQHASSRLQDVDLVVSDAVKQNGLALQYASPRLQDSYNIVLDAVKHRPRSSRVNACQCKHTRKCFSGCIQDVLQHASSRQRDNVNQKCVLLPYGLGSNAEARPCLQSP